MLSAALPDTVVEQLRHAPVMAGYSGGLDSTVLLHWLSASSGLCAGLHAVHVHHGLHPDADAWVAHCERACARLGVPLRVVRVDVRREGGQGLEGAARHARHAAFGALLREGEVLALAHHRDDQAETFLLRALRASGADGLRAMRDWRRFGPGWLWRPLLALPRTELLAYARHHGLDWIDDPGNVDTDLDRNFLRHRVLPVLRERWPQADAAFARAAALCGEAVDLLAAEDAAALARVRTADPQVLSLHGLREFPAPRRARVLRRWVDELGLPPLPSQGVAQVEAQLLDARADAHAAFAWHGSVLHAWRDLLHADWQRPALPSDWVCAWDGASPLRLPDGSDLQLCGATGFAQPLVVHARRGGERIVLTGRTHSHALKHVLQDLGIPPWERERLPLLSDGNGELLAAGDVAFAAGFERWLHETGHHLRWARPGAAPRNVE